MAKLRPFMSSRTCTPAAALAIIVPAKYGVSTSPYWYTIDARDDMSSSIYVACKQFNNAGPMSTKSKVLFSNASYTEFESGRYCKVTLPFEASCAAELNIASQLAGSESAVDPTIPKRTGPVALYALAICPTKNSDIVINFQTRT